MANRRVFSFVFYLTAMALPFNRIVAQSNVPLGKPTLDSLPTKLPTAQEVREHVNQTIGYPGVYDGGLTDRQRDAKGDGAFLGYESKAVEKKPFTTKLKLAQYKGYARLAVLADDSAVVTVDGKTLSVGSGALWRPASFKVGDFLLAGGKDYDVAVQYENKFRFEGTPLDVDGVTLYAFGVGTNGIYKKWQVDLMGHLLNLEKGGSLLKASFCDDSGFPTLAMDKDSSKPAAKTDLPRKLRTTTTGWIGVARNEGNIATTLTDAIRYVPTDGDQVHHIIPKEHEAVKATRDRAAKVIVIETDKHNLVALPNVWHQQNTKNQFYFDRVNQHFAKCKTKQEFYDAMDSLAQALLKESGKLE